MKIQIDNIGWTKQDIGERILREYEKGEISTRRAYELLKQLFDGRTSWNPQQPWENV
jgi:hypothetical protein